MNQPMLVSWFLQPPFLLPVIFFLWYLEVLPVNMTRGCSFFFGGIGPVNDEFY
jgi:hypothetical protein